MPNQKDTASSSYSAETLGAVVPRYVRSRSSIDSDVASIVDAISSFGIPAHAVQWLPGFVAFPGNAKLTPALRDRFVALGAFPMDAASEVPVRALLDCLNTVRVEKRKRGLFVLDVCCAPGGKLLSLRDKLNGGTLHGVDVSSHRLDTCISLLSKHLSGFACDDDDDKDNSFCLFCGDGRTFPESNQRLVFASEVLANEIEHRGKRRKLNKSARARRRKALAASSRAATETAREGYDLVLVDAECTTDGSFRHAEGESRSEDITALQRALLRNGFRLLRPGGTLVYSTCSLREAQNEDVVRALLEEEETASLLPLPCNFGANANVQEKNLGENDKEASAFLDSCRTRAIKKAYEKEEDRNRLAKALAATISRRRSISATPGTLKGTLRFGPECGTSGLFVAKISKR